MENSNSMNNLASLLITLTKDAVQEAEPASVEQPFMQGLISVCCTSVLEKFLEIQGNPSLSDIDKSVSWLVVVSTLLVQNTLLCKKLIESGISPEDSDSLIVQAQEEASLLFTKLGIVPKN